MNMADAIVPKSDQINADDLIGRDMTITIRDVQIRGGQEQPVSIFFDGSDKAFRPCKSMSRVLVACWGADARQYIGRSLTLYRDPTVKWGGLDVGGIRISHMSHLDRAMTMALTATKGSRKPYTVKPLAVEAVGGLTAEDALADMDAAATLDELKAIWSRRTMAPHRSALQADLDRIKARLSETGRPETGMGEAQTSADELARALTHLPRKSRVEDVESLRKDWLPHLDPQDQDRWNSACDERIDEIRAELV